jgi:leucyl aminopeptidase (aminopeptidase T)
MDNVGPNELGAAAARLVASALKVKTGDHLVVVADRESEPIAAAVAGAATSAGAQASIARLDQLRSVATNHSGERPHRVLPDVVRRAMLSAQASVFVASALHHESSMRDQLLHIVGACSLRHAHMPGITSAAFARAHSVDYDELAAWGRGLERRLEVGRKIEAESAAGTKLVALLGPQTRWTAHLGAVTPGRAVSFPAGALFASPMEVEGEFVADASVGEFFGAREGLLADRPVRFVIEKGFVTSVQTRGERLREDIQHMLGIGKNSARVGLLALGVNAGVGEATGDASLDLTRPGLHVIIGDAMGRVPGLSWSARTSFAACQRRCTVRVDGEVVADEGVVGG